MKRTIPLFITFASGLLMVVQYYVQRWNWIGDALAVWFQIITAFAYILGAVSMVVVNGKKIQRRSDGWIYNLVLLLALVTTLVAGFYPRPDGKLPTEEGSVFDWIFRFVYSPLSATTYSLLAFFIASAAFRAFKAKSLESTLLLVTALFVIFFRVPAGESLVGSLPVGEFIEQFIMGGFNTAGQRAVQLGASIGLISVSLKIILGVERSYLGGGDG